MKVDYKEFRLVQNFTKGAAVFNQFLQLRIQLVIAVKNFAREETLSPVLLPRLSKDLDEQLKPTHKVDWANRKICVTRLRYSVDKPESCHAQFRKFARKKEDERFQQTVVVEFEDEEVIYLLVRVRYLFDNVIGKKPICNVL